ncbi:MAG: S-layer homology domain-containing protein [Nigerium sp.]|nr:S-layer homology domain-containing protein [Nigerium sp.]
MTCAGTPFADFVSSRFVDFPPRMLFLEEIEWLANSGVTTGWVEPEGTRTYRPWQPIARDAMAAFLYRLAGSPSFVAPTTSPFTDVTPSTPFYKEMTWLQSRGITTGYPDGTFRPADPVNRDAMAAFMYRFKGKPAYAAPSASPFTDVATTDEFFKEMAWLRSSGVSTGWPDGTYRPGEPVTRDAMAAFLYRLTQLK